MRQFLTGFIIAVLFFGMNFAGAQVYQKVTGPVTFTGNVTSAGSFLAGNGTQSIRAFAPASAPNTGFYFSSSVFKFGIGAADYFAYGANFSARNSSCYRWSSTTDPAGPSDTQICRDRAAVMSIANAAQLICMASPPASPEAGDLYCDTTGSELCFYDGAAWQGISSGTDANCS